MESVHHGVLAVANRFGDVLQAHGDADRFAYFRSSAKPFQAVPLVTSGAADHFGFTPAELALACASHTGEPSHCEQVTTMLEKLDLDPTYLKCGAPLPSNKKAAAEVLVGNVARSPLHCDCSGKHTGMLAVCRMKGYDLSTYLEPDHPLQREVLDVVASMTEYPANRIEIAADGCSVPTFGMPIAGFATSYAKLADPPSTNCQYSDALGRLRDAMIAHPRNVGGTGIFVSDLMEVFDGQVVAKSGAEGLICIGLPAIGIGIAIRVADGSFRSHPPVVMAALADLHIVDEDKLESLAVRYPAVVQNHNGWVVGQIRSLVELDPISPEA